MSNLVVAYTAGPLHGHDSDDHWPLPSGQCGAHGPLMGWDMPFRGTELSGREFGPLRNLRTHLLDLGSA